MGIEVRKDETYKKTEDQRNYGPLDLPFGANMTCHTAIPCEEFSMTIAATEDRPEGFAALGFKLGPIACYAAFDADGLVNIAEACVEMAKQLRDGSWDWERE